MIVWHPGSFNAPFSPRCVCGAAFGGRSADELSAAPEKHLIEEAPFGRLDQMLRTTI